jgi:alkylation response protein AidB-like acyl-CoA dehydrogenase
LAEALGHAAGKAHRRGAGLPRRPVAELCGKLDEWRITWELRDLPPEVWDFLKRHKFFAMIIPKRYGGLGFSATAHSEVIRKISTRSLTAAVTAMVPNSLGPGELLLHFGTKAQQDYWLPRLTAAEEIPCFALTSPEAGSDAASMIDSGVVCGGTWQGREVIGIKLNWHKRYITLGPIATVIGLAFKLHDPDHLLGEREDIGVTVALVPANLPGVEIGRRHLPTMMVFQNGPTSGRDVFIPLDHIIGGEAQAGKGWRMLMKRARSPGAAFRSLRSRPPAPPLPPTSPAPIRASASNSTCPSAASGRSRSGSAAWRRPPISSTRRGGSPAPTSTPATSPRSSPPS